MSLWSRQHIIILSLSLYVMFHAYKHIIYHASNMQLVYFTTINSHYAFTCTFLLHTPCSCGVLQYHTIDTYKVMQPFPFISLCIYIYTYIICTYHISYSSQYFHILVHCLIKCPCTHLNHFIHWSSIYHACTFYTFMFL